MDRYCTRCAYAAMVARKYGKTLRPLTCDLFEDDGCPHLFEVSIDNRRVFACRDVRGDRLEPGDLYIAKRNTGWKLGKCLKVDHENKWVMSDPPCKLYSYDCHECHKVLYVEEDCDGTT
jgi:hypothetical protein